MAAAVCNVLASARNLHVRASSAGLFARDGAPATDETVAALAEKGIPLAHTARKLTSELADSADIIVPITPEHSRYILQTFPTVSENKIALLPSPIKDPFGGNLLIYRDTLAEITQGVNAFLDTVEARGAVDIVPMEAGHLEEVYRLEKRCFSDPWTKDSIREVLFYPHGKALIALHGDKIAGYLFLFHDKVEATVANVAVAPAFRGLGIGEELLRFIIDEMRTLGVRFITLEVRSQNTPAISLYEKLGFTAIGSRKNYYKNPTDDAHLMKLIL